ncbi:CD63 antigen-like [Plodia interpunctella]|uniref:CD63 antigen-like n=1 Tax=Plodia interpunctella TaxID=58824 RepID=UPI0023687716|nr:CD63 antigen-like [Plodia interpunctella]
MLVIKISSQSYTSGPQRAAGRMSSNNTVIEIAKMWAKLFTTVKYTLVIVNFLFLITGIIILSVGSSVQSAYNGYHEFLTDRFLSLPAFCIATGVIVFLIAFFGFYGAYTENYVMIMAFAGAMLVMFIFQLSACIAGYALKSNTIALVQQQLYNTMPLYHQKEYVVEKLWDETQDQFECCGVINATDWLTALDTSTSGGLPVSCCRHEYGAVATFECTVHSKNVYTTGCSDAFGTWVRSHAGSIGAAGIFLVLMQALAVAGALWMAKVSREEQAAY